jgi:hypothetical protein
MLARKAETPATLAARSPAGVASIECPAASRRGHHSHLIHRESGLPFRYRCLRRRSLVKAFVLQKLVQEVAIVINHLQTDNRSKLEERLRTPQIVAAAADLTHHILD